VRDGAGHGTSHRFRLGRAHHSDGQQVAGIRHRDDDRDRSGGDSDGDGDG